MSLEDDLKFLKEAYRYASRYSDDPDTQTGAVIVLKGKIIAKGGQQSSKECCAGW